MGQRDIKRGEEKIQTNIFFKKEMYTVRSCCISLTAYNLKMMGLNGFKTKRRFKEMYTIP
jgi:hypothetical protein